jgi:hypothetical protein
MKNLPSWLPILRNINSGGWLISRKDIQMAMDKFPQDQFPLTLICAYIIQIFYQ